MGYLYLVILAVFVIALVLIAATADKEDLQE